MKPLFNNFLLFGLLSFSQIAFSQNTYYGSGAGTSGWANSFFGYYSGNSNSGNGSTIIGYEAGRYSSGSDNVLVGFTSGRSLSGSKNSFFGGYSGRSTTSGNNNVFFGYSTGYNTSSGSNNTFLGYAAGNSNTTGSGNIFIGYEAGRNVTTSNKLYLDNSSTSTPLIYGDFSANRIGINNSSPGYTLDVGGDIKATNGWVRSNGDYGLYNNTDANHFFSDDANYWRMRSGNGLIIADKNNTRRGVLYHNSANGFGLLDGDGNWSIHIERDSYTAFLINNTEKVRINNSGNVLDVQGTIHANTVIADNLIGTGTSLWDISGNSIFYDGNLRLGSNAVIDDDATLQGNSDDWIRLNGFIELKSNTDSCGIVLRDKDNSEYFGLTQKDGYSYLTDNSTQGNYFLRGNGANVDIRGDLYLYGSDLRENNGSLRLNGDDNLYISMDYNNDDADTRSILFGKNDEGGDANWVELMRIKENGNVGIGSTSPNSKLEIKGNGVGTTALSIIENSGSAVGAHFTSEGSNNIKFQLKRTSDGNTNTELRSSGSSYLNALDGNVSIGTTDAQGYKLAVNGSMITTSLKIRQYASWPDYVFNGGYKLLPIAELDKYITENGHLPDVPSEEEVTKNGVDVSEINSLLLKKIEELTLYMINAEKRIDELEYKNKELEKKLNSFNK